MEEKKQRGIFFSKGIRILTIVLFVLSIGFFSAAAVFLAGLFRSGLEPEDLFRNGELRYEETNRCGNEVGQFMHHLYTTNEWVKPFATDGKLDLQKTVDITNPEAKGKEKNKNTTYTVENLKKLLEHGCNDQIRSALYGIDSGYYGEEFYDEETYEEEMPDEENLEDTAADRLETAAPKEVSAEYSQQFRYLYSNRKVYEEVLPESGKYLADYAKENPEEVSLMDLYQDLCSALEMLQEYYSEEERLEEPTNIMYIVENIDTNAIYTNVPAWKNGYDAAAVKAIRTNLRFQAERRDGTYANVFPKELSEAERIIMERFRSCYLSGENENIAILMNPEYPVSDIFARNHEFYSKYAGWGKILLLWAAISFLTGVLAMILMTVQAGRIREDRELHLRRIDRIPAEVMLAAAAAILILMCALGIWCLGYGSADDLFVDVLCVTGEMALGGVFMGAYLSLIRRMKGRQLWKSSLCHTIIKSCKNVYMARKTSGRMIIAFILLVLANMFTILVFRGFGVLLALIGDGIVLLYLVREGAGRQVIKDGLARIADGELDFKINAKELIGDNREMAEAVNHVGDGLQNAVKETLKSERLKADLITNVSHDIKTPLTSIINYVDLLKREDIQDPKIKGYIDILDSKSQRLKQLTEDLVEASKISSGNVVLDMQPIRFNELVWQTNGEFEEKFKTRNLELVCKIPEEPMVILADGRRMWRVVENLYNNVAKYAMANTRVYVEVKKIGCRIIFELKNISEHPLNIRAEELTERFIRGDVSRSTEGSGLGLSIAQNLVKLQNGTFDIYLDGDLFKVTLTFESVQNNEMN